MGKWLSVENKQQPFNKKSTTPIPTNNDAVIRQWTPSLWDKIKAIDFKNAILSGVPNSILGGIGSKIFNKISDVSYQKAADKGRIPYKIATPIPYKPKNAAEQGLSYLGSAITDIPLLKFNPGSKIVSKALPTFKPIARNIIGQGITGGMLGGAQGIVDRESPSGIAQRAAFGAALGGGLSGVTAGLSKINFKSKFPALNLPEHIGSKLTTANESISGRNPTITDNSILKLPQSKYNTVLSDGDKIRKFNTTLTESPNTVFPVKDYLEKKPMTYSPITNAESLAAANKRISDNLEDAVSFVKDTKTPSAEHTTTAIQLINKFQNEGNYQRAIDVAESIAPKLTKAGQAIQAASIYNKLSPEGILLYAQKHIKRLNDNRLLPGLTRETKLTEESAQNLKELAEQVHTLEGSAKEEASQELQAALQALGKSGIDRKIESAQTIAQLLNPRTIARNTIGNELFYRLERVNKYIASPVDWAKSAITGADRTVTFRTAGQGGYWEGFLKGAKAGWKGTNPMGLQTQYDLTAPAFTSRWNPLTYMEKTLGATLKGFDFAAYNRAVKQTIGEMAELKAMNQGLKGSVKKEAVSQFIQNTDSNILDIADQYGKYITFQDQNVLSKGLSAVKRGLNVGKEWGAGSVVVKYPKTPGALIMRSMEYSPAGFLKSAYTAAKPILKGTPANSRETMLALSRAITGSLGFSGLGYYLADNGVITGSVNKDADVRELEKNTGGGSYKVNASALARWVKSGFNSSTLQRQQGDMMYSYDWAAPIAMAISFGSNVNQNIKEGRNAVENTPSVLAASAEGALNTIAEQPVLQGITRLFQGYDLGANVVQTLKSIPASFAPTLMNQIRQLADNTGRSTYDPSVVEEAVNMVKNKIPGLEETLPAAYTTAGKQKEVFQNGSNNIFNVMFNPGFVSNYQPTQTQKEIIRIYNSTGDKIQFPRYADKSFKYQDKMIDLTAEEYTEYQRLLGQETEKLFVKTMRPDNKAYKLMTDAKKAEALQKSINAANEAAKQAILKSRGLVTAQKKKYLS